MLATIAVSLLFIAVIYLLYLALYNRRRHAESGRRHTHRNTQATSRPNAKRPNRPAKERVASHAHRLGHSPLKKYQLSQSQKSHTKALPRQRDLFETTNITHDPLEVDGLSVLNASEETPLVPIEKQINQEESQIAKNALPPIIIYLKASDESPYNGQEVLQQLLMQGLRYGDYRIFHYYVKQESHQEMSFSVASLQEPGTFDIKHMPAQTFTGLTFFLIPNRVADVDTAYRKMCSTAEYLVSILGGTLLDAHGEDLAIDGKHGYVS